MAHILILGRIPVSSQKSHSASWHGFHTLVKNISFEIPVHLDMIASHNSQLHIHAANLLFCHIRKVFHWIQIWSGGWGGQSDTLFGQVHGSSLRWLCDIIMLELAIIILVNCDQECSGSLWHLYNALLVMIIDYGPVNARKRIHTPLHQHHQPEPVTQGRMGPWIYTKCQTLICNSDQILSWETWSASLFFLFNHIIV